MAKIRNDRIRFVSLCLRFPNLGPRAKMSMFDVDSVSFVAVGAGAKNRALRGGKASQPIDPLSDDTPEMRVKERSVFVFLPLAILILTFLSPSLLRGDLRRRVNGRYSR